MSDEDFHGLAMHRLDGRRISSITRVAMMLAKTAGEKLMRRHFEAALVIGGVRIGRMEDGNEPISSTLWPRKQGSTI